MAKKNYADVHPIVQLPPRVVCPPGELKYCPKGYQKHQETLAGAHSHMVCKEMVHGDELISPLCQPQSYHKRACQQNERVICPDGLALRPSKAGKMCFKPEDKENDEPVVPTCEKIPQMVIKRPPGHCRKGERRSCPDGYRVGLDRRPVPGKPKNGKRMDMMQHVCKPLNDPSDEVLEIECVPDGAKTASRGAGRDEL
jgi:hypothetical protein